MPNLFGIIGYPLSHSLTPKLQNKLYEIYGIDATCYPFEVEENDLAKTVQSLKNLKVKGFIVTIPYKEKIIEHLDRLTPTALKIGAVNVVMLENGNYVGYNFDGEACVQGALQLLQKKNLQKERVLLVGAGGAARSIYYELSKFEDVVVDIANRSRHKAENLLEHNEEGKVLSLQEGEANQSVYDIIIQTTSLGMYPLPEQSPIKLLSLKPGSLVVDIIYNPTETRFLMDAKKAGATTQNGIYMLGVQNALALNLWTGQKIDSNETLNLLNEI